MTNYLVVLTNILVDVIKIASNFLYSLSLSPPILNLHLQSRVLINLKSV